jgi:hypothetical protein
VQGNGSDSQATPSACIDAETLAAWADGGLSKAEAALVEVHLADCERCTAMLATFARTIPELPAAESLWTRWHLRWLVPVATAATVAALWVLVPSPESPQIATLKSERTIAPQAPAPAEPAPPAAPSDAKEQESRERAAASTPADTVATREESPPAPAAEQFADARRDAEAKVAQPRSLNETVAVAPPPPAREADPAETSIVDRQTARAASPPAPSTNQAPAAAAPVAGLSAESAAQRAVVSPTGGPTPLIEVASPDPMTRWRVVGAGQVERTTTGGAQWERAMLPESATLTAGSSPSPSVCWLVGRTGAIYVTTDGLRFVRVPFRDRTDFVSIQAIDGRRATVVTIDGRTMRTEDQGANWIRISP